MSLPFIDSLSLYFSLSPPPLPPSSQTLSRPVGRTRSPGRRTSRRAQQTGQKWHFCSDLFTWVSAACFARAAGCTRPAAGPFQQPQQPPAAAAAGPASAAVARGCPVWLLSVATIKGNRNFLIHDRPFFFFFFFPLLPPSPRACRQTHSKQAGTVVRSIPFPTQSYRDPFYAAALSSCVGLAFFHRSPPSRSPQ